MTSKRVTGLTAVLQLEAEAAHYGLIPVVDREGRKRWRATCAECAKESGYFNASVNHADQLRAHFKKNGWAFGYNMPAFCSTQCARTAREAKRAAERERNQAMIEKTPPPTSIGPNPMIIVTVVTLLNENFDRAKHLYASGWSDARVAKEAQTSVEFVANFRRTGGYGELAENPEYGKLRADLKALEDLQADLARQISVFKSQTERVLGQHNKAAG